MDNLFSLEFRHDRFNDRLESCGNSNYEIETLVPHRNDIDLVQESFLGSALIDPIHNRGF